MPSMGFWGSLFNGDRWRSGGGVMCADRPGPGGRKRSRSKAKAQRSARKRNR